MQFAAMSASYNFRFHFWKWKCGETNRGRSRGSSSSSITRLQKLCHVFSLFLANCGLGSLTANSSARIVFASCLPGTVCVCVVSVFMWYIPVTILSLSLSLSALWHAHCRAPFCLPACRHGNFITCPQICEAHSLRLFLSSSLSLLLIHMNELTHVQQHVVRSQQLRTGRPYWCVRVSERACQNERAVWEQKQQQQRESELCSAQLWAQPSVASTQRRGEYEKGSLSRWHICVVSVAFVRLELLFGFCVCTADRDACGLLAQQYYKHIHIYNTHTHTEISNTKTST